MKMSYKKLWILLIEKNISPATLRKDLNIATGTIDELKNLFVNAMPPIPPATN